MQCTLYRDFFFGSFCAKKLNLTTRAQLLKLCLAIIAAQRDILCIPFFNCLPF